MDTKPALRLRVVLIALGAAGVFAAICAAVGWAVVSGMVNITPIANPGKGPVPGGPKVVSLWLQDFNAAKDRATREKKDILLSFEGSDWCIWCQRMEQEIFATKTFLDSAGQRFVLVKIDFPRDEPARSRVQNPAANDELQRRFGVTGYPAVVLTDHQGEAFGGVSGFFEGGAGPFVDSLGKFSEVRIERDSLLAEIDKQEGVAKLAAAKRAQEYLNQRNLRQALRKHAPSWYELARQLDPKNEQGYLEQFFEFDWFFRFEIAPTAQLQGLIDEAAEWRKQHGEFKDKERAAFLWMELAKGKVELEDFQGAFHCLDEGLKLQPKDAQTRQQLQNGPLALGLGTGTAFAVSDTGHFLTNAHVAGGPGKAFLRLPGSKQLLPAQLVAERLDLDLAVLKCDLGDAAAPKPLPILADHAAKRGEEVAVWGYPLGTTFGHGLKLTKGVVSGLPEQGTRNMLLLDVRINPGNSGSPLCDAKGNVLGIVTARGPVFGGPAEVYGLAVPAKDVVGFLEGLQIKSSAKVGAAALTWDEVEQRVSPAVAMVVKARPTKKVP